MNEIKIYVGLNDMTTLSQKFDESVMMTTSEIKAVFIREEL